MREEVVGDAASTPGSPTAAAAAAAFAALPNDLTGIDTFERYLWQTKLSVLHWLATLGPTGPLAVVAEMVEDLVVVEQDVFRFAQLKTRDRGSWSAAKICGKDHAVSGLVASYRAAKDAGILDLAQFEVWLEGPPAADPTTKKFFADPTDAPADIKAKIREMGLKGRDLTGFLSRLRIHSGQPSRQTIDAVVIRAIGATWPYMQFHKQCELYETLLQVAVAAQAATESPLVVRKALAAAQVDPDKLDDWAPIASQVLLRGRLVALCPPLSSTTNEELFERAASGETTLLELKLVRAGASDPTVEKAISARADAVIAATLAISGGIAADDDVTALNTRLLAMADSVAALGIIDGVNAPAEHVFHTLMSKPSDVVAIDPTKVFGGDHRLVVGHLCDLSDECLFGWGAQ